jgi:hypothetical protein
MKKLVALAFAVVALAGCSSKSDSKSDGATKATTTTAAPHIPDGPLGQQIQYAIDVANGKVASNTYSAHFSSTFLNAAPPAKLDQVASELKAAAPYSLDRFLEGPFTSSAVLIIKSPQGSRTKVSIRINPDATHVIEGLLYQPYGV